MLINVGINGFGRIGRLATRILGCGHPYLKLIALNSRASLFELAHLLKYDSVHHIFKGNVDYNDTSLIINDNPIWVGKYNNPKEIPWKQLGVDIVLETTGKFTSQDESRGHLEAGAKKVIISAPGKNVDGTFIIGVNHKSYNPIKHHIISNASCTSNCLAPIIKILNEIFGFEYGLMTTVHSYTMSQRILDGSHKDIRRARAAAMSIIPTNTGASKTIIQVLPTLKGKLDGLAIRVPTPNVSLVDLTCRLTRNNITAQEVNDALEEASLNDLNGILECSKIPLVSIDYTSSPFSSIVDTLLTKVINNCLVKIIAWYDNEMGFTYRLIDLTSYLASKL